MAQEIALSTAVEVWPTFKGETWEEHVDTWRTLAESVQGHLWQMGAVAASLYEHFGGGAIEEFAAQTNTSKRRVEEYAFTYNEWTGRDRSQLLSFHHHTIAARADDPDEAIRVAENERLSTRQLEGWIRHKALGEGGDEAEMQPCPACGGTGSVPKGEAERRNTKPTEAAAVILRAPDGAKRVSLLREPQAGPMPDDGTSFVPKGEGEA